MADRLESGEDLRGVRKPRDLGPLVIRADAADRHVRPVQTACVADGKITAVGRLADQIGDDRETNDLGP
jgi:hypothetical protein